MVFSKKSDICIILLLFVAFNLCSQDWIEWQEIFASDGEINDKFGISVSIEVDIAAAGAFFDNDSTGAVYLFQRIGDQWEEQQKLIPSDAEIGDKFGASVCLSGDYLAISAYGVDDIQGAVYIFQNINSVWEEQTKILASDGTFDDVFGQDIYLSNSTLVVGAPGVDVNTGAAYVFQRNGNDWEELLKLIALDREQGDLFGMNVSMDEDYIAIAAPFDDITADCTGSVYIFHFENMSWIEQDKLTHFNQTGTGPFGTSVSISGDYVACGAFLDEGAYILSGSAYIFERNGSDWEDHVKLFAIDPIFFSFFGGNLLLAGDDLYVSASGNEYINGFVYHFKNDGNNWNELTRLCASDSTVNDGFGCSLSNYDNNLLIGAYGVGQFTGSAYLFINEDVGVENNNLNPLSQSIYLSNHPNPFNPSTEISFLISDFIETNSAEIGIYNLKGQKVRGIPINSSTNHPINSVTWNGTDQAGKPVSSGVYYYNLNINGETEAINKCLLLK
ncbi:MAG: T9SS type A sorting domain-containing protein [Candidatus Tenebribacter burtonii]|jgi:hypothetical protein|nr:T9SS type A sorting domain-containing protein [Candidatus Tenebribacter burtonii]